MLSSMLAPGLGCVAWGLLCGNSGADRRKDRCTDRTSGGTPVSSLLSLPARCGGTPDVLPFEKVLGSTRSICKFIRVYMSVYMSVYTALRLSLYGHYAPKVCAPLARPVLTRTHVALTRYGATSAHKCAISEHIDRLGRWPGGNPALVARKPPMVGWGLTLPEQEAQDNG